MQTVGQLQNAVPDCPSSEELFCQLFNLMGHDYFSQSCLWLMNFFEADRVGLILTPSPADYEHAEIPPELIAQWPVDPSVGPPKTPLRSAEVDQSSVLHAASGDETPRSLCVHRLFLPEVSTNQPFPAFYLLQKWRNDAPDEPYDWRDSSDPHLQVLLKLTAVELARSRRSPPQSSPPHHQTPAASSLLSRPLMHNEQVIQNLKISFWEWNLETNSIHSDDYLQRFLGHAGPLHPHTDYWTRHVHPVDLHQTLEDCQKVQRGEEEQLNVLYRMRHADGSWRWIRSQGQFLNNDPASRIIVGADRDVTAEVEAGESANRLRQNLVYVTQLSTIGEMAAALAHEITQPVTAIRSYAAAIRKHLSTHSETSSQATLLNYLTKIEYNTRDASAVIEGIRGLFSTSHLQTAHITLGELVDQALTIASSDLKHRQIALHRDSTADDYLVEVHSSQIVHVLLNLINNACQALDEASHQSPQLSIETTRQIKGATLAVADNGPGIPREIEPTLFHSFATTKTQGMGMGLAISKRIIEAHGGTISVSANHPSGAVFKITFP